MRRLWIVVLAIMLTLLGMSAVVAASAGKKLEATMTGANEFPGPGDENGSGFAEFRINQGKGTLKFEIEVDNITLPATAAHIHPGQPGEANPPVITLTPPDASGRSEGVVRASKALLKKLRKNPGAFYVNVHNADFPDGAIRGQLERHR
jgi:hypothetical protein